MLGGAEANALKDFVSATDILEDMTQTVSEVIMSQHHVFYHYLRK